VAVVAKVAERKVKNEVRKRWKQAQETPHNFGYSIYCIPGGTRLPANVHLNRDKVWKKRAMRFRDIAP